MAAYTREDREMNINIVATTANKITKPKKKSVFHLVKSLIKSEAAPTSKELAELYAFFLPPIPAKPKTPEQWVYKAVPKNDIRYYLNSIHVKDGRMMGTDGHRLHFTKTDLPNGYYDSQLSPLDEDAKYPDVDRVIPKGLPEMPFPKDLEVFDKGVHCYKINGAYFNKKYVDDALCGMDNPILHQGNDNLSSILITSGDLEAVIMPMRL